MKHSEKIIPVAAALTALSAFACCLPLGIVAAAGAMGLGAILEPFRPRLLGAILEPFRPRLLGLSVAFLVIGLFQLYRSGGTCQRRSRLSIAMLCVAAVIVVGVTLFPQLVAGFLAGQLP